MLCGGYWLSLRPFTMIIQSTRCGEGEKRHVIMSRAVSYTFEKQIMLVKGAKKSIKFEVSISLIRRSPQQFVMFMLGHTLVSWPQLQC